MSCHIVTISFLTRINKTAISFILISALCLPQTGISQETQEEQSAPPEPEAALVPVPAYSIETEFLSQNHTADDLLLLEVENQEIPVLKHLSQSRKTRGQVVLLHTQGENPEHIRLVSPLARQLKQLGWEVFVPLLPIADFPPTPIAATIENEPEENQQQESPPPDNQNNTTQTTSTAEKESTQQADATEKAILPAKVPFFADGSAYQKFTDQLVAQLINSHLDKSKNILLIANDTSAFWSLSILAQQNAIAQVVMIDPQIPDRLSIDLKTEISNQSQPLYVFFDQEPSENPFKKFLERNSWPSQPMRTTYLNLINAQIHFEDTQVARKISGWVDSQNENSLQ